METRQQKVERLINELDSALRELSNEEEVFNHTKQCGKMLRDVDEFFGGQNLRLIYLYG